MKKYILTTLLGLLFLGGSSAKSNITWNKGILQLTNGSQLRGELNYNWKAEIIQVKQPNGTIKAYSAPQIQQFTYYDNDANLLRRFVSVDLPVQSAMVRTFILEAIAEGPMMVYRRLRRMREVIKFSKPTGYSSDNELLKDYDNFQYIVALKSDSFVQLDDFNLAIWPQLEQEFGSELRQYIRAHGLDTSSTVSKLILISHYNSLRQHADEPEQNQSVTTIGIGR